MKLDINKIRSENPTIDAAIPVLEMLSTKGHRALIVGGCVRDLVMGKTPKDIDIATNKPISEIETMLKCHFIGKMKDFGLTLVTSGDFQFEVANFRSDGTYTDNRHPDSVKIVSSFFEDASRRDFTVNAMGLEKDGTIIDHFGGMNDIKIGLIKAVGDANKRFEEDALRMIRALRFASVIGFNIDSTTFEAIKTNSWRVKNIAVERIKDEMFKAAKNGRSLSMFISLLDMTGILPIMLPEINDMKKFEHTVETHPEGNCYAHMIASVMSSSSTDPLTNIAVMYHDIGKNFTYALTEDGKPSYIGHDNVGSIKFEEEIGPKLKFSADEIEAICFGIKNHMRFFCIPTMSNSRIISMLRNKNFKLLVDVSFADSKSRLHKFDEVEWQSILDRIAKVEANMKPTEYESLKKRLDGFTIMRLLNLKPGPKVGQVINRTLEWALDNEVKDLNKIYEHVVSLHEEFK